MRQPATRAAAAVCPPAPRSSAYDVQMYSGPGDAAEPCRVALDLRLNLQTDRLEESPVYSPGTLVANLGGFVGLVTGFALFTLADLLEEALLRVVKRWRARVGPAPRPVMLA